MWECIYDHVVQKSWHKLLRLEGIAFMQLEAKGFHEVLDWKLHCKINQRVCLTMSPGKQPSVNVPTGHLPQWPIGDTMLPIFVTMGWGYIFARGHNKDLNELWVIVCDTLKSLCLESRQKRSHHLGRDSGSIRRNLRLLRGSGKTQKPVKPNLPRSLFTFVA